jgi:cyclopropane-fatty-acyl-phospholipid synthase
MTGLAEEPLGTVDMAAADDADAPAFSLPAASPVRRSWLRRTLAELVFRHAVSDLPLTVILADGSRLGTGRPGDPVLRINRPGPFFARLGSDAKIGFGEGYQCRDWEPGPGTDLADLLTVFAARLADLVPAPLQRLRPMVERRQPAGERNTPAGARANIHRHYDLPPTLFRAFLDHTMTYSAAVFAPGDDLAAAQRRKIDSILDSARVGPGTAMLEIGTGWGELAIRAARRGAAVTSVTLSAEQRDLARQRIAEADLADRVRVQLADYRSVTGDFDAIVSVEMVEAVGHRYWPTFVGTLERLLRPGGTIGLQTILMPHDRMMATRNSYTWIHKYVFPGGIIPSYRALDEALTRRTSLRIVACHGFGQDYARTLRLWRESFLHAWPELLAGGFPRGFRRMWEFYLAYCEAGFRAGYLDVTQLRITRPGR